MSHLRRYPYLEERTPAPRCWRLPWRPLGLGHPWRVVVYQPSTGRELYTCSCGRWLALSPTQGEGWRRWRWR